MAELNRNEVFKVETLTQQEYADKYGDGVTVQGLKYAMDKDLIDCVKLGKSRYIVMTEKTKTYVPNSSPKREEKQKEEKPKKIKGQAVMQTGNEKTPQQ